MLSERRAGVTNLPVDHVLARRPPPGQGVVSSAGGQESATA